jgi:hypothetical protein
MGRGLPQEVIEKAKQEVSLDDRFCFECKRCGGGCLRCEIVLTPYDILRLCQRLRMTSVAPSSVATLRLDSGRASVAH